MTTKAAAARMLAAAKVLETEARRLDEGHDRLRRRRRDSVWEGSAATRFHRSVQRREAELDDVVAELRRRARWLRSAAAALDVPAAKA